MEGAIERDIKSKREREKERGGGGEKNEQGKTIIKRTV